MTFSPLTSRTHETAKRSSRSGRGVQRLIIHHTAGGTDASNLHVLAVSPAKKSCTYLLETTGALVGIVPEEYRPWTSGSAAADGNSVTVETVNISGSPDWRVAAVQVEMLAHLAADLCRRYGWGVVDESRVDGHRDHDNTACPGPHLYPLIPHIIARANQINDQGETTMATADEIAQRVWLIGHNELGGQNARDYLKNLPINVWMVRHKALGNRTAFEALATLEAQNGVLLDTVKALDGVDPERIETALREAVAKIRVTIPEAGADQ